MWNFYQFLHPNSGVTPPYAQTPSSNGSFPFTPPWAKPTGGTAIAPYNGGVPAVPQGGGGLPAVRAPNALAPQSSGKLGALLDFLRPLVGGTATSAAARSTLGPWGTALMAAGQAMKPTPMGAEPPQYTRNPQGQPTLNPGAALQLLSQAQAAPAASNPVPLPQARPAMNGMAVPMPPPRPGMPNVPLPQARPYGAHATAPVPQPPMGFYNGPGSMAFGAGDQAPGLSQGLPFPLLFGR